MTFQKKSEKKQRVHKDAFQKDQDPCFVLSNPLKIFTFQVGLDIQVCADSA